MKSYYPQRLLGWWTERVAFIGAIGILLVAGVILLDVLARLLFNRPILSVDELGIFFLAVVVTSFLPAGLVTWNFVTIRFLGRVLGLRGELWLETLGALATLVFFVLIAWQIALYALDVTESGLATLVLKIPVAPWWWVISIIFLLCVPIQILVFIDSVQRAIAGREPAYKSEGVRADTGA